MRPDVVGDAGGAGRWSQQDRFRHMGPGDHAGDPAGDSCDYGGQSLATLLLLLGLEVSTLLQLDTRPSQVVADDKVHYSVLSNMINQHTH